ncbi:Negative regulator of mitotic exit [Recurvomyces mirabilis]|nr:Negative regulator of mitotic exit [Recurvomyces mirabilis]
MSFLFKSSKKGNAIPNGLQPATRDIKSSDGPQSQIPTLNGVMNGSKPGSPTPHQQGSVNTSLNSVAGDGRSSSAPPQEDLARKQLMRTQQEGMGGPPRGAPSPEQKMLRENSREPPQQHRGAVQPPQRTPSVDPSPYPWSQRRLNFTVSHTNPFPRYGAAVNATSSKDGSIYLMGGLINGSTVKGDLWMVEAGAPNTPSNEAQMTCFPVATTSEGPGPRVGHASLLVGNAFIVFGGDTKMDDGDQLDDTLYLLNTSTKQWSRALPAGPRPPGRYGHTLNILGSKIYIFGGQVEGYFFNDLVAFDLNALQQATNRWEILIQNTIDGGPPHGQIPPARTNHSMISWNDKLYLFGGTDGVNWYNDVWSYSPHTNSWTQLDCIGYIPSPREGHAAALVGDVMYIFGGRTEEGNDLGDLAAFRITSRRWYTFQNMGPSPSPRSGHSMTTVGKSIVILAGEPSSAPRDPVELGMAYYLDTAKIRYPPDSASQTPVNDRIQGTRRPSGEKGGVPVGVNARNVAQPQSPPPVEIMDRQRMNSGDSFNSRAGSMSKLPRITSPTQAPSPAPTGPPPQAPGQQAMKTNGVVAARQPSRPLDRALSPSNDAERAHRFESNTFMSPQGARDSPGVRSPVEARAPLSPGFPPEQFFENERAEQQPARYKPETYQPSQDQSAAGLSRQSSRNQRGKVSSEMDHVIDSDTPRQSLTEVPEQLPKVREVDEDEKEEKEVPQDSGIGSSPAFIQQHDELVRELEAVKQKNAWFASELALARKSGYSGRASADSPVLDERAPAELFQEEDKPLIEALLKMRSELARVQETIDQQARGAAERIAAVEKQRDNAINEAVFARTRLAGQHVDGAGARGTPDQERHSEMQKRLASSLNAQGNLSRRIENLMKEVESEKQTRGLAEETADAAHRRVTELESHRQAYSSELDGLRAELHDTQTQHRDLLATHSEISSQHQMLTLDKDELSNQLSSLRSESDGHTGILSSLREAVTASTSKAEVLERKLDEERGGRDSLEQKLRQLKNDHEERTAELETTTRRLRDAEELSERHAHEAKTHRDVVMAGFGKVSDRGSVTSGSDERVVILQQRVSEANEMVRQNQAAADAASQKLRSAEERIAGLEAYQEQASREGLSIRKQLQVAMKDKQAMESERKDLEVRMQRDALEANALSVQHSSLKDILAERGINAAEARRSRALDSPNSLARFSTPDLHRVKELEQQLEASLRSHDDMKSQFEEVNERDEKMKREYEDKLTALDNDHQAAVKYLRGTEKMLSKMKQELQRVKNENGEMKKKLEKAKEEGGSARGSPDGAEAAKGWEQEREKLMSDHTGLKNSVTDMEGRINTMQQQLQTSHSELEQTKNAHATSHADLMTLQSTHQQTRGDIEHLQKENSMLEERARDAENKVQLLLDQVEHSVDNYRRQSRIGGEALTLANGTSFHSRNLSGGSQATTTNIDSTTGLGGGVGGHSRNLSAGGESTYSQETSVAGGEDGRNSLALDSLASELDALRSHWETTNKNYRLSDKFDFETSRTATAASNSHPNISAAGGLAGWRAGLAAEHEEEVDGEQSRPTTGTSTIKGEDEVGGHVSGGEHGQQQQQQHAGGAH